ncbi:TatD DNase family protein [Hathewaya proteolytica DSM 3090]|uniref:TatD DNase family protein n=1 Tax=Hathewaya proteolytica DSM 3090 TaxID=1121331 RepID=A0A1M6SKF2_9CLOT|nr:TatD family hydrolase [Hathewaya proteolytica]SHK45185.1 TatD DNase family protein [Hathewaya proteolytica DSM 3090]
MIFDSHAHYDDEKFDGERETLIQKQHQEDGVVGILNCGSDLRGTRMSVELSHKFPYVYAAVGIHPEEAHEFNHEVLQEIKELAKDEKVKAIGEIGLDYYWEENPPKEIQKEVFIKQMILAEELQMPVVIHCREAHEDTLNIVKQFPKVRGVIHCFSGSLEMAREFIKCGYYIGFTGVVTFKNSKKIKEVAREVPMERILVETDCPYMAPVPHRGERNQSSYISNIIEVIAEIRGASIDCIEKYTVENTKKLFKMK